MVDWLGDLFELLNKNSGAVQAVATCVLVTVTFFYVRSAAKQAKASVKMAEEIREQRLDMDRPYLLIEVPGLSEVEWEESNGGEDVHVAAYAAYPKLMACCVYNAGRGPAKELVAGCLQPLVVYREARKEVLRPGESWDVCLEASQALTYIQRGYSSKEPLGIEGWLRSKGVDTPSLGNSYDCGLVVCCTDIHDRGWATYLKLGLASETDEVRNVVMSRTLLPTQQRIVPLGEDHDS